MMRAKSFGFAAVICLSLVALVSPANAAAPVTSGNLIRNAGAEKTTPTATTSGDKIAVKSWSVSKSSQFTAVAYGSADFLPTNAPGPKNRGHNFFAGGPSGTKSHGTQIESLTPYKSWISGGKATFALAGWLGGYASQGDYATLTVSWETSAGKAISENMIGPVTAGDRKNLSELLHRSTSGKVPASARQALITVSMVRDDGSYIDGYADDLSLVITKP
jgi:hypothetical protein